MGGDENEMLLGLDDGTLLLYNPKSGRISKVDAGNLQLPVINGIVRCDDGTYCLAGSSGLFTYCNGKVHECNYINEKMQHVTLTDLTFDKDKNMWISTYGVYLPAIPPRLHQGRTERMYIHLGIRIYTYGRHPSQPPVYWKNVPA